MATSNYTLRIDETDRANAEQIFKNMGMSLATGINVYLKTVIQQRKIPFILETGGKQAAIKLNDAFEKSQRQAVINGTDNMTMDEIDALIAEVRREKRGIK